MCYFMTLELNKKNKMESLIYIPMQLRQLIVEQMVH